MMFSMANLTPMLVMTNAEIDKALTYGLYSLKDRKIRQSQTPQRNTQTWERNDGEHGKFRITHATGYIEIRTAKLCELPFKHVNEFLRFAKAHGNNRQQNSLLAMLEEEKRQASNNDYAERIGKIIQKIKTQRWGK